MLNLKKPLVLSFCLLWPVHLMASEQQEPFRRRLSLKLNFYYSRRYWKKPKVILTAGIGHYPDRLSQYSSEWIDGTWQGSEYWEVKPKFPIGFHGGVSLEYPPLF